MLTGSVRVGLARCWVLREQPVRGGVALVGTFGPVEPLDPRWCRPARGGGAGVGEVGAGGGWGVTGGCLRTAQWTRASLNDLCGQVYKCTGWMPWHQEPKKDVVACDKPRGSWQTNRDPRISEWGKPRHSHVW